MESCRLNDLPNCILHHILSFLDTESSVRTSLLSKRWTDLWKGVNVLDLRASSFRCKSSLQNLLSSRQTSVENISFQFGVKLADDELFDMVMRYAAADAATASRRRLQVLSISSRISPMANSIITRHHLHESLTTLKLEGSVLDPLLYMGFNMLTTLELHHCTVAMPPRSSANEVMICDPFADLPSLTNLKLLGCFSWVPFRVSGRQLLNLEIRSDPDSEGYGQLRIGEVSAPKLESLYISGHVYDICNLGQLHLPSLAHASVHLDWPNLQLVYLARNNVLSQKAEMAKGAVKKLLQGLQSTESLNLCFDSFAHMPQSQQGFPLTTMKPLIEQELSSFYRLKTVKIQYPQESPSICDYFKGLSTG